LTFSKQYFAGRIIGLILSWFQALGPVVVRGWSEGGPVAVRLRAESDRWYAGEGKNEELFARVGFFV